MLTNSRCPNNKKVEQREGDQKNETNAKAGGEGGGRAREVTKAPRVNNAILPFPLLCFVLLLSLRLRSLFPFAV